MISKAEHEIAPVCHIGMAVWKVIIALGEQEERAGRKLLSWVSKKRELEGNCCLG